MYRFIQYLFAHKIQRKSLMKKITAISLILLANCIILVHAVVPHHHHDCCPSIGLVYETEASCHCCDVSNLCDCGASTPHTHNSKHSTDGCKLQDLLSQLVLNTKERELFVQALDTSFQDFYIADLLVYTLPQPEEGVFVYHKPFVISSPTVFLIDNSGLRAPPYC